MNVNTIPLNDAKVRRALSMAINRIEIVNRFGGGLTTPAYGVTPPMFAYPAVIGFEEDIEAAQKLLVESDYPDGEGFPTLEITVNKYGAHILIAEYIQKAWSENLGIETTFREIEEWEEFMDITFSGEYEIKRGGWFGNYLDPQTFLGMWDSNISESPGWSNQKYDGLLRKASEMEGGKERFEVLRQAEELLIGEEMALIPIYYYANGGCLDTEIWGGWYENVLDWHPPKWIHRKY